MLENIYYVVQFEDGSYFKAYGLRYDDRTTNNIMNAKLYNFDWEIPKDIYMQQYLYGKNITYRILKVKVTKTVEILNDEQTNEAS